jgi:hypothetical protein
MSPRYFVLAVAVAFCFAGCSVMEQYHLPQTQDKVPVNVIVAFGDAYPNDTIKSITEQKMFDGTTQYKFTTSDRKNVEHTVAISQDGKTVANPL